MTSAEWQEAFLYVAATPLIDLTVLAVAFSILWAVTMPLMAVGKLLRKRWR
jgi:hypothetical protein